MRLALIGVLLLSACGEQASQVTQGETPTEAGSVATTKTSGPLPDYLLDYPNSTRVEIPYLGAGPDRRSGNAIAMETDATPAQVAQYYRDRFAAAGMPIRADTANANGGLISVGRDGESGAMLTISNIDGKTRIAVMQGPRG